MECHPCAKNAQGWGTRRRLRRRRPSTAFAAPAMRDSPCYSRTRRIGVVAQFASYHYPLTGWNMPMATKCVMMAAKVVPIAKRSQRYRCQSSRKPEA